MLRTIDADQHLFEPRTMWADHIDPGFRDKALTIQDDELGYAWLTWCGRRLYLAESQVPTKPEAVGAHRNRLASGLPPLRPYDEELPPAYDDVKARLDALDEFGLDAAVLFPNFGLLWESMLADDVEALCANMSACNRWMADTVADGAGRLFGVAHLSLRDREWAVSEIARLGRAGVRLAMIGPAPVERKPLSHRSLDPVWAAFCEHGVTPVFHVANFESPLHPAWHENDPEPVDRLMDSVFLWVAPAVALANLIITGTLERFSELRIGVVELTANWVPSFLLNLDGAWDFYAARHGGPMSPLPLRPSEYFLRQVRVAALPYEGPARLVERVGEDTFMFGSDWPHAEGVASPLADYERAVPRLEGRAREQLFGGNAAWLLRLA